MELKWIGNINSGHAFTPEKASYHIAPNGHGWRACVIKQSSAGDYSYKITNAKTGAVIKEDTVTGTWSYFTLSSSTTRDGLIFESKGNTASHVMFADIGADTPSKV